jgi:hypothetical protein
VKTTTQLLARFIEENETFSFVYFTGARDRFNGFPRVHGERISPTWRREWVKGWNRADRLLKALEKKGLK